MLTKTEIAILQLFVEKITQKWSIKQVADKLKKPYPLIHRTAHALLKQYFLEKDDHQLLSLAYKKHHTELAYVEGLRKATYLKKNKIVHLFVKDILEKLNESFFILLVFGSSVEKKNPRDIDILLILENKERVGNAEKLLVNIAKNFTLDFDVNVITTESMQEMLKKRDEPNVMNETLNKHILLFGAENYYRVLAYAR